MRLIIERSTEPAHNLAREEVLLNHVSGELVYLWRNRPAVIIGRHQNTLAEIDEKEVLAHDVAVVRRLTGGGAVFHDLGNVNFSFLFSGEDFDVEAAKGCRLMMDFLQLLGLDAQLTGRNDICVQLTDGTLAKIAGTAMTQRGGRGIFHGCLLFDCDTDVMEKVLTPPAGKLSAKGIPSVRGRVANLKGLRPQLQEKNCDEFFADWAAYLSGRCEGMREFTREEEEETEKLMRQRYQSWQWNYGRNPAGSMISTFRFPIGTVNLNLGLDKGRIKTCTFSGDYMDRYDFDRISESLAGVCFDRESIAAALAGVDLCKYFGAVNRELILDFMTGRRIEHEKD